MTLGITSQVPLTKAGEDMMGGDGGGSVRLGEELLLEMFKFISGCVISINSGCTIPCRVQPSKKELSKG